MHSYSALVFGEIHSHTLCAPIAQDPIVGTSANVVNVYFDTYFPKAINTSAVLRKLGGEAKYIYTTHSYLVSLYLECPAGMGLHYPSTFARQAFLDGIQRGDITWHAFPFNAQAEWSEPGLLRFGVELSQTLAARFNITGVRIPSVVSQRDVPGTTRGWLRHLAASGVRAVSIGANSNAAPAAVPSIFKWFDVESNTVMTTLYHPGDYGGIDLEDCVLIAGHPVV